MARKFVLTVVFGMLFSTLYLFAITISVPGNSDFVMYINLNNIADQELTTIFQDAGITPIISVYGKLSFGSALNLSFFEELEDFSLKALVGSPIGVVLPGKIGDKSLEFLLNYVFDANVRIPKLTVNEATMVTIDNKKFYIIRSKDNIYLCFNKDISMFTKDMLNSKISSISLSPKDDVVAYFKTYKKSLIGELLYTFGDYFGIPVSDELVITKKGENYRLSATINKTFSDYEKKLVLTRRGILKGLSYLDSANVIVALGTSDIEDCLLLSGDLDMDIPQEIQEVFEFLDIFNSIAFSSTLDGYFAFSGIYKPENEQDAQFIASLMKNQLSSMGYQVLVENQKINIYPAEIDKTLLKSITENASFILSMNYSDEENSATLNIKTEILDNGNLSITGEFENLAWLFENIEEVVEAFFEETYEEEWEYDEYEEEEESDEEYEEDYTTEETIDYTTEEEYYEEWYEEEYTTEEYSYSELEYEIVDEIVKIFNACADYIRDQGAQEVTLEDLYDYGYIDYIPDYFDVKSAVMNDGTVYVVIHVDVSQYDVEPSNIVDILYYDNDIYSDIINGKISVFLYVVPQQE
ncbi:hypothetical protein Ferpe_0561 [Fervidobacterium pennivorans DSM 9078]|uniref:Uncharacterized protein n=1 Tax=Fervidobacterium pennivorans (strain DSM 9078 / Ven5) TaxID=771875 RepID=H9UB03_FERPD|nr:hypothetical protein [Fervidobacterium pennivorans]AFG34696.1 hypothetical protein Ferpe_0561 [Fervidobacterium pennivorans DSM 9078]